MLDSNSCFIYFFNYFFLHESYVIGYFAIYYNTMIFCLCIVFVVILKPNNVWLNMLTINVEKKNLIWGAKRISPSFSKISIKIYVDCIGNILEYYSKSVPETSELNSCMYVGFKNHQEKTVSSVSFILVGLLISQDVMFGFDAQWYYCVWIVDQSHWPEFRIRKYIFNCIYVWIFSHYFYCCQVWVTVSWCGWFVRKRLEEIVNFDLRYQSCVLQQNSCLLTKVNFSIQRLLEKWNNKDKQTTYRMSRHHVMFFVWKTSTNVENNFRNGQNKIDRKVANSFDIGKEWLNHACPGESTCWTSRGNRLTDKRHCQNVNTRSHLYLTCCTKFTCGWCLAN